MRKLPQFFTEFTCNGKGFRCLLMMLHQVERSDVTKTVELDIFLQFLHTSVSDLGANVLHAVEELFICLSSLAAVATRLFWWIWSTRVREEWEKGRKKSKKFENHPQSHSDLFSPQERTSSSSLTYEWERTGKFLKHQGTPTFNCRVFVCKGGSLVGGSVSGWREWSEWVRRQAEWPELERQPNATATERMEM